MRRSIVGVTVAAISLGASVQASGQSLESMLPVCAPLVHPLTMGKIVKVESRGRQYALADAGPKGLPWKGVREKMVRSYFPATADEAEQIATRLIAANHIVAIGLSQVSSENLKRFGLNVRQVLDPCTNLRTGSTILTEFYLKARRTIADPNRAILAAISAYNTGNFTSGFSNGYVKSVVDAKSPSEPTIPAMVDTEIAGNDYASSNPTTPAYAMRPRPQLLSQKLAVLHVTDEEP
ncbi:lytic transglycosylase domain-containing protein [Burkholderia cenocepacia]|uniref:lytic transglycosylase domain-containing protein n=1 Tax=Burkholderia cenocepacia TaxID=95486 RepID=UPI001B9CF9F2|nr:lytic transglycosylase domain-containing protein [Burkholderia cenocepacia]